MSVFTPLDVSPFWVPSALLRLPSVIYLTVGRLRGTCRSKFPIYCVRYRRNYYKSSRNFCRIPNFAQPLTSAPLQNKSSRGQSIGLKVWVGCVGARSPPALEQKEKSVQSSEKPEIRGRLQRNHFEKSIQCSVFSVQLILGKIALRRKSKKCQW